jgi:large repetitive protein
MLRSPKTLLLSLAAAAAVFGALTGVTRAAFSSTTTNPSNSFAARASFCTGGGTQTVSSNSDTYVQQDSATTNNGTRSDLFVQAKSGSSWRTLVNFNLPAQPAFCSVTSATLTLSVRSGTTGRTIQAFRAASSWTETGVTWNNQPATTGTATSAASVASGNLQISVTSQVQAMYSGSNFGFIVKDSAESDNSSAQQRWISREGGTAPSLSITFG